MTELHYFNESNVDCFCHRVNDFAKEHNLNIKNIFYFNNTLYCGVVLFENIETNKENNDLNEDYVACQDLLHHEKEENKKLRSQIELMKADFKYIAEKSYETCKKWES